MLKPEDKISIQQDIEQEGFDYAFVHYSGYEDIKDDPFHRLREAYLAARKALSDYVGVED